MFKKGHLLLILLIIIAVGSLTIIIQHYFLFMSKPVVIINSDIDQNIEAYITNIYRSEKDGKTYVMLNIGSKDELRNDFIDKVSFMYSDDFNRKFTEIFFIYDSNSQTLFESFIYSTDIRYFSKELQNKSIELNGNIFLDKESGDIKLVNGNYDISINIPKINLSDAKFTNDLSEYFKIRKGEGVE